jgi:hypothetical protein
MRTAVLPLLRGLPHIPRTFISRMRKEKPIKVLVVVKTVYLKSIADIV